MQLYRTWTGQSDKSHQTEVSHQTEDSPKIQQTSTRNSTQSAAKDPLAGHLNHLTAPQEAALGKFKSALHEQGLWRPGGSSGRPSHDDATLLRYLRARKFDVNGAIGQFSDTERWLKEQRVEDLYEHYDVDAYERARKMYPQWTGHRDRRGIPLYVYVIKHLDSKNVSAYQKDAEKYKKTLPNHKDLPTPAKLLPLFALYQNLLTFVLPMCSTLERPNPEVPVTNSTNIVDISNVGLTQFWNLKGHMQDASVLATAHYPETLDRIFIIGAPSFFPTVWGWIKRWFDPVTVSKIFILGKHEMKSTLESYIDPEDFPKRYGGKLDWDFGMLPHMDDASLQAVEKDGRSGWVDGPCLWLNHQRFAVGTVNGKPRRPDSEIAALKPVVYAADKTDEPVHPDQVASHMRMESAAEEEKPVAMQKQEATAAAATAASEGQRKPPLHTVTSSIVNSINPSHPTVSYQNQNPDEMPTQVAEAASVAPAPAPAPVAPTAPAAPFKQEIESATLAGRAVPVVTPTETKRAETPVDEKKHHHHLHLFHHKEKHADNTTTIKQPDPEPNMQVPGRTTGTLNQVNMHESLIHDMTTKKMQDESVSVIPGHANGSANQGELLVASDPAKGLALETARLNTNGQAKPPIERFVTAMEGIPTANGQA